MFEHLQKLEVTEDKTSALALPQLGKQAKIHLRHAGYTNPKYVEASLAWNAANPGDGKDSTKHWASMIEAIFPSTVVSGWSDVPDASGKPVPFSLAACKELFAALLKFAPDVLVAMGSHAVAITNYRDLSVTAANAEAVAKNS